MMLEVFPMLRHPKSAEPKNRTRPKAPLHELLTQENVTYNPAVFASVDDNPLIEQSLKVQPISHVRRVQAINLK